MNTKTDRFYSHGKFFENQEGFWEYVKQWPDLQLDQETLERMIDHLKTDILLNVFMYERKIKNCQMNSILENAFLNIIKELNQV